ncbi:unnamed protein product [Staurois parvus]|uniref:Immunoglobulin V-set domain-containing protein n=1 Tax=Staurois parvus TaxID=386267 RepID=A0ABN9B7A2_9NEOB|nr:unnamed protein product [Staurois parvus]
MTQTPKHISVSPGEKVQINCNSNSDVTYSDGDSLIYWFQKRKLINPQNVLSIGQPIASLESRTDSVAVDLELRMIISLLQSMGLWQKMKPSITVCRERASRSHSDTTPYKNLLPLLYS